MQNESLMTTFRIQDTYNIKNKPFQLRKSRLIRQPTQTPTMLPMLLTMKAVMNPPNLSPIHQPIQPKTIMPINIHNLFIILIYISGRVLQENIVICGMAIPFDFRSGQALAMLHGLEAHDTAILHPLFYISVGYNLTPI